MINKLNAWMSCALLLLSGARAQASTVTNADPAVGGIGYSWTIDASANDSGTFKDHTGAWSWEDQGIAPAGGEGWTHTSRWVALTLQIPTVLTITMSRDETVPYAGMGNVGGFAAVDHMYPSLTLWSGWDNDVMPADVAAALEYEPTTAHDHHTYANRGNVIWAEDIAYRDHIDNTTATTITRTWYLPAGNYTLALGSNSPSETSPPRQGFSFSFTTSQTAQADLVPNVSGPPANGGIGYSYTVVASPGGSGSVKTHVGAWSWEDESQFAPGEPAVGWTHTSKWVQVKLPQDALFTMSMDRDATVPWVSPNNPDPNQLADTTSMFPSFTLFRGADQDGGDHHTYNNKGRVAWAEDINYIDHLNNSTDTTVSRTWRLPAGDYTMALGSNAPATNPLRQGFSFNWSATAIAPVTPADPGTGGIGYGYTIIAGAGDSGSLKTHVGAWSWEDNSLFGPGDEPVGWTHTSKWVALMLKDTVTFSITMARDATVPWVSPNNPDPNQLADTNSMFPSLTLWRGWDNDGGDHHTYNNHGNVDWAEDLSYVDHIDNSTQNSITRSWTLPAGLYSFVLGSNAPANNSNRQGFSFSYSASAPVFVSPVITKQPVSLSVNAGQKVAFTVTATGPSLNYQWFKDGVKIDGATTNTLNSIVAATLADAGSYKVEVRNAAGAVMSNPAILGVVAIPVMNTVTLPDVTIGQVINATVSATNNPTSFLMIGRLPVGVAFNARTGAITGRAVSAGDFAVSFKAANRAGTSTLAQGDTITVAKLFGDGVVRSFTGVLGRSSTMNSFLGGSIRINTTAVGGFTGTLVLGAKSYPLNGLLDTSVVKPTGMQTITRVGQTPLVVSFAIDAANKQAAGTLMDGPWSLDFTALQPSVTPATYKGNYTLALKLVVGDQGVVGKPQGYGFGAFTLAPTGITTGVITLADETKVSFSAPLEHMGNLGIFKLLYANLGSVIAVLHIDSVAGFALDDSKVDWFKTGTTTGVDRVYRDGFGPIRPLVIGRQYVIPTTATTLSSWLTAGTNNAKLTFAEGGAPSPSTRLNTSKVTITAGSPKIATIDPNFNPGKATLKFTPGAGTIFTIGTTGSFTGTFKLTDTDTSVTPNKPLDRLVTFNGMIVNDGTSTKGYGCFLLPEMPVVGPPKTTILTSKKLSGSVLLEAQTPAP